MRAGTKELPMQRVAITLVPSDAAQLACAWAGTIGGARCEYDASGEPDTEGSSTRLIPVMTLDRELLLVAGIFQTPALAAKLAEPGVVAEDKRLTVECTVKTAGTPRDVRTRFRRDAAWSAPERARAIEVVGCVVP
ncbi:MAG TPA: hypothetical protein PKA88_26930 [Polyangiaceae bacterium]|nr:hypothetical protein [Polyangiaceae bacterium]